MSNKFETSAEHDSGTNAETSEPLADRVGAFTPEIGAHRDAADAQPSHADLLAREKVIPLTEEERALGREAVERAKKTLGYS